MSFNLITILGPTAAGKTKLAAKLAFHFNGEIISADSRQVYKKMDIGTGKDLSDYSVGGKMVPYHLIDICEPSEEFNLYLFIEHFNKAFLDIQKRNKIPFLAGGTGLYLNSVLQHYRLKKIMFNEEMFDRYMEFPVEVLTEKLLALKPKLHNTSDLKKKERIVKALMLEESAGKERVEPVRINSLVIGINPGREEVRRRITERLTSRLGSGMIEEVKNLLESGMSFEKLESLGLEYKYIALYLKKDLTYDEMFQKLNTAIHNFAKRQMTWFRKMEREGVRIIWLNDPDFAKAKEIISGIDFNGIKLNADS